MSLRDKNWNTVNKKINKNHKSYDSSNTYVFWQNVQFMLKY